MPSPESSIAEQPVDHVRRVTDAYFDEAEGQLIIGGIPVADLARDYGTPLFVYDRGVIEQKIVEVRRCLPDNFELFYSIKANPNASLLRCFLENDCGLEVASGGELFQCLEAGCPPRKLIFAGPGKTQPELQSAVDAGIREIHIESIEEARVINNIAGELGKNVDIAVRVNPVDGAGGAMRMGGQPSPFGIDEENLTDVVHAIGECDRLRISGVHLFMATQVLDANVLIDQYRRAVSIAERVARQIESPLDTIDFGGGWGTPYFPKETTLDLDRVATGMNEVSADMKRRPLLAATRGVIEPGRFLVNEAGLYIARVTRIKESRGSVFAITDGGMHHHLAASGNLGQTIKRNFPVALVNKLFLPAAGPVNVVGPLCTPLDALARKAALPSVEAGDLFGVFSSGAYARTSSPHAFLSHNSPLELLVSGGKASIIRRRGVPHDYLRDQGGGADSEGSGQRW